MEKNTWFQRGLEQLKQQNWHDAIQMLEGALNRAYRNNQSQETKSILSEILPYMLEDKQYLACTLLKECLDQVCTKNTHNEWLELIPFIFSKLEAFSSPTCIQSVRSSIIMTKAFQQESFFLILQKFIEKENNSFVVDNLQYCFAALLCQKKDYLECFQVLQEWKKKVSVSSLYASKLQLYLTLAELNAYEIETGDCGRFLDVLEGNDSNNKEIGSLISIGQQTCHALATTDLAFFEHDVLTEYSYLINMKYDPLLNLLCMGIVDILRPAKPDLLGSLFGTRNR